MDNPIFVFGSNLAGRHGRGAALFARRHRGAKYGQGYGRQGNSFAIPTKDRNLNQLSLHEISFYVHQFLKYTYNNPELVFELTPIGCGLASHNPVDIREIFGKLPDNVMLSDSWVEHGIYK